MRLETKLGFSTGVLICVMLLIAGTAHMRIQDASRISGTITGSRMPVIMATRDARLHMTRSIMDLQSYMLFRGDPEAAQTFRVDRAAQIERLTNNINSLEHAKSELDLGDDALKLSAMEEQAGLLKNLQEQIEGLVDTRVPANRAKADSLLQKELIPGSRQMFQAAMQLSDSQRNKARADALQLQHTNKLTLLTLWIATVLGAIVGAIISILLGRHITEALEQVSRRANAIAGGDLTGEELMLETGDQIGALAVAMNRMQGALGSILGTVADTAGSLTGSAASMRSASDQIHRRIDQQSQQTQQAATAMQEMSASIAEVSRHTHSAAETARSAAQTARDGGTIVKRMLGSMQQIATAVSETSETVGLLGEDSKRISQIVTVINEIARKTNLLALNAAIEAARAGDQGRGFAVVAGEVRRLAESTAQATGEIGEMIAGIQQRTHQAIASMESGTGMVLEGVGTTTRAGEALERIIGMAEQVDRMITQIAIAASQQATAADQSSASLDSIHMLSHDNLNEMATTAAGIESLRGTAVTLEKQVDRFQVMHA